MRVFLISIAGLLVVGLTPVAAMQGQGFHLSVGAGAGVGAWDVVVDGRNEHSGTGTFNTSFKLGFAPSDRVLVYYQQRTAWFNSDVTVEPGLFGGPATPQQVGRALTQGLSGLGVSYYLASGTSGLFVTGGFGLAWWSQVFEESTDCIPFPLVIPCDEITGFGATAGLGYDLSRRFAAELLWMWGDPSADDSFRFDVVSPSSVLMFLVEFRLF